MTIIRDETHHYMPRLTRKWKKYYIDIKSKAGPFDLLIYEP